MPLYELEKGKFIPCPDNLKAIEEISKKNDLVVQFHLPFEDRIDSTQERGLSMARSEHHLLLLQRFEMFNQILKEYGLGETLTIHPPQIVAKGKKIATFTEALKNACSFFWELDQMIIRHDWHFFVAVENQADPKKDSITLGYEATHFREMLRKTQTIGLCIDLGHRMLAEHLRIRDLVQLGLPIENIHFHRNPGEWVPEGYGDDVHKLVFSDNVDGYYRLLENVRRWRIPLVLEISHLECYSNQELEEYVKNLQMILE